MSDLLEHRLEDYAYKLIDGAVKQEYENMIDNWGIEVNKYLGSAERAFGNFEATLTTIKQEIEEERRAEEEFAMLALALLAGPVLSFVAGALQYQLATKIFRSRASDRAVRPKYAPSAPAPGFMKDWDYVARKFKYQNEMRDHAIQTIKLGTPQRSDWSRTKGKVFGDFGGSLVQSLLINPAIKAAAVNKAPLDAQINLAAASTDLASLKSNIENVIKEGKKLGSTAIANYAGMILHDREYGRRVLKKVQETEPGYLILNDEGIVIAGQKIIRHAIDEQRRKWAQEWLYFGNQPQKIFEYDATVKLEVEMWRLWILNEEFQPYASYGIGPAIPDKNFKIVKPEGRTGIVIDKILDRLFQLGVLAGRNSAERDRRARLKFHYAELTQIEGRVDNTRELDQVLNWAAHWKAESLAGNIPYTKRASAYLPLDPENVFTY